MSMKFVEEVYVPSNDVMLIVAQIQELYVTDNLLQKDGLINLSKGIIFLHLTQVPKSVSL